jgi:hypothetical protein
LDHPVSPPPRRITCHRSLYKWVPQDEEDDESGLEAQELSRRASGAAATAAMAAAAAAGVSRRAAVSDSFMCFDADPQVGVQSGGGVEEGK